MVLREAWSETATESEAVRVALTGARVDASAIEKLSLAVRANAVARVAASEILNASAAVATYDCGPDGAETGGDTISEGRSRTAVEPLSGVVQLPPVMTLPVGSRPGIVC